MICRERPTVLSDSKQLEWLWRNDLRYSHALNPKRIKQAFADPIALKRRQEN